MHGICCLAEPVPTHRLDLGVHQSFFLKIFLKNELPWLISTQVYHRSRQAIKSGYRGDSVGVLPPKLLIDWSWRRVKLPSHAWLDRSLLLPTNNAKANKGFAKAVLQKAWDTHEMHRPYVLSTSPIANTYVCTVPMDPKNHIIKPLKTGGGRKGVGVCGLGLSPLSCYPITTTTYYAPRTLESCTMHGFQRFMRGANREHSWCFWKACRQIQENFGPIPHVSQLREKGKEREKKMITCSTVHQRVLLLLHVQFETCYRIPDSKEKSARKSFLNESCTSSNA